MAYPTEINNLIDVVGTDTLAEAGHAQRHNDANTALESVRDFINSASAGQVLVGTTAGSAPAWTSIGYRLHQTVYFTSNGTFTKATYPWLRAVKARVQGGGGGGGGASNNNAGAGGGGGGGYSEVFITDIAGMSASVTVTVGSGGAGGAAGNNNGVAGGNSSFGSYAQGNGGGAGNTPLSGGGGGASGAASLGNLNISGQDGSPSRNVNDASIAAVPGGLGGSSMLGFGGRGGHNTSTGMNGGAGDGYGGGGGGAYRINADYAGGNGTDGIVILELYA